MKYKKPVLTLMKDMIPALCIKKGQEFTRSQVKDYFNKKYPDIKNPTISKHLAKLSVNAPSRVYYSPEPYEDDMFFQVDRYHFRLYIPEDDPKPIHKKGVENYLPKNLSKTEHEAIIKARIGQGKFRKRLLNYWSTCAVTGCKVPTLLRASHIKPWAKCDINGRLSLYNGLLLSPTLDACFDSGVISFNDSGMILISNELDNKDMKALGITKNMKLSHIESEHRKYLAYHREYVFKKS